MKNYKGDFPIFHQRPELIYLDNAATSQKPQCVLDAMLNFYRTKNSNIHRGPNFLAEEATIAYENARQTVADFIGAKESREIIFTRNATESINLVARTYGEVLLQNSKFEIRNSKQTQNSKSKNNRPEILLSRAEHHANIVPWLQLKKRAGVKIRYFDVSDDGRIIFDPSLITKNTALISITGMSNVTGAVTDIKPITDAAHKGGAKILLDACQLAVHPPIDVQALDVDFLVFSGHKMYGPGGIGVLYAKQEILESLPPFLGGGDMINEVFEDHFTPADLPNKFEAGTPNIAGAIGLEAAIWYIRNIGFAEMQKIEEELTGYLLDKLRQLPFMRIVGPQDMKNRGHVVSFLMDGVHPHDIAEGLSQKNICIRAGHHCCQVLMDKLGIPGTARISLAFYNTKEEIDKAVEVLGEVYEYFNK